MALLRNREVALLGKTDGQDESPTYTVMYKDGNRENVRLNELQLTEEEHKNLTKLHGDVALYGTRKIDDKSLQEIRDGQDRQKIEQRQKTQGTAPVEVSKIMVDPAEVAEKTPTQPQAETQPQPQTQPTQSQSKTEAKK